MTHAPTHVRLVGLTKTYGGHVVLADAELEIPGGQFVVIVGRSGSGKSTLLNLIGGLDDPTAGEVHLLGQRLSDLGEDQRSKLRCSKLGFVFQFFNLIPTLTVEENIRLPLALNNLTKQTSRTRANALLEELGLNGCNHRFPEELSGGEQQRVAVARALAHEPAIVLADEPTGNLDLETARDVLNLLDATCRRHQATLVMATHSREMIGLADRVLTIRGAHLEEASL